MPARLVTAVVRHDRVKASGSAPVPWWSITKTALAAAALVLAARGRLALDEPVGGHPFTLRHLLQHRSGLRDYGSVAAYHAAVAAAEEPWPVADLLRLAGAHDLLFEPGEGWSYSNIAYLQVRHLIERAADAPLAMALHELLLAPLGIAGMILAEAPAALDATEWGNARRYHPGWVYHGLLVGPAGDAALLLHRLLAGRLLPGLVLREMRTLWPVGGPLAGRPWDFYSYGLGLTELRTPSGRFLGHTGAGPGSTAAVYRHVPDGDADHDRRTAAAFAPLDDPAAVEGTAMALAVGGTTPKPRAP